MHMITDAHAPRLRGHACRLLPLLALLLSAPAFGADSTGRDIERYIRLERLSPRVLVLRTGVSYFDAVTVIATRKGLVVFDAGSAPTLTSTYRRLIEKEFGRSDFTYLVETHAHWDHVIGNRVFPEAIVVGHERCREELERQFADRARVLDGLRGARANYVNSLSQQEPESERARQLDCRIQLYALALADLERDYTVRHPALTFSDRLTLDLGDLTLELTYFGRAHSASDLVAYVPEEALLMAGDLFNAGGSGNLSLFRALGTTKEDVNRWHETLETMLQPERRIERILDGHGALLDRDDLVAFQKNVDRIWVESQAGRTSAAFHLKRTLERAGVDSMLAEYRDLMARGRDRHYFFEEEFLDTGDDQMGHGRPRHALAMFRLAAELFPDSWNAHARLAEACLENDERREAIAHYERALRLDPRNEGVAERLDRLRSGR
jgi:glyoxylase-like metal-dependent hydrolase (beta-lactamase superfamily II)